ncbi:MAG: ATP-dependent Clp protease ATP-binding subunit [Candidatus Colwellbacteria bacterium]|nr:ATP-dependent Clp protease ATP-binding subunit [Candidatus Colwellbacteria bacterium]
MAETYFKDRYFELSVPEKVIVRIISTTAFVLTVVSAVVFLFSDFPPIRWTGIVLAVFLLDKFINRGRPRKSLKNISTNSKINIADHMTPKASEILGSSFQSAKMKETDIGIEIAKRVIEISSVRRAMERLGVVPEEFEQKVTEYLSIHLEETDEKRVMEAKEVVSSAFRVAIASGEDGITPADLFAALGDSKSETVSRLFSIFEIEPQDLNKALLFERLTGTIKRSPRLPSTTAGFASRFFGTKKRTMNRAWTSRPTPTLDTFGWDMTDMATSSQVGFMVGHKKEYERMVDILSRPSNPNVILVGDPGIGKETIIGHLAYRISKDEVPDPLFDKRLVALNISALVSGADQAELQRRINAVFSEVRNAGNIILYVPEIHNLSRTSGELFLSAANIMLPLITADDFPTIGTTYPQEFKRFIERDSAFAGAFETIQVEELPPSEAEEYLVYESILLEKDWKMTIAFEAIKKSVFLAKKYFHQKPLPSSAEDLLKEALSDARRKGESILTPDDIVSAAERRVNIPIHQAGPAEAKALLGLEDKIHERMIDQVEAVSAVSRSLREYRSGLSRKGGPIAAFLFVGPTGVGKTELAKALSRIQFGSEEMMIRIDMSEYQERDSITRLLGSADGKIYGNLSEAVLEKPYSLILLDEFEKANSDVLNIFLQVIDDGRLTDGTGRPVDFQNTIIIATSNAQSNFIKSSIDEGKKIDEISVEIKRKLTEQLRPELLNRFSDIIVFKSLSQEDIFAITSLQLKGLSDLLLESQGVSMEFDNLAKGVIAEAGYDPSFGARPLRSTISKLIKDPLSAKILGGEIERGSLISVTAEDGRIRFISSEK